MIECVFTIDYELHGNGEGSLRELIHEPTDRLIDLFERHDARFVCFVEAAELEKIEASATDPCIHDVHSQMRRLHELGFEIALHLHPQWCNARYRNGRWILDYGEYNLCTLSSERIEEIVRRSVAYLRRVLDDGRFIPLAFRAGNWLFQPTETAAAVLAGQGVKIDSSVFKGGVQRNHNLDYRRSSRNGYFWRFSDDANVADDQGTLIEVPIHTAMVPSWKMLTAKRVGLQRRGQSTSQSFRQRLNRVLDYCRPWYPLKFDFCRMTLDELTSMVDDVLARDAKTPTTYKPMVAIGHSKDLVDFATIDRFLSYLRTKGVRVCTFERVYEVCASGVHHRPVHPRPEAGREPRQAVHRSFDTPR
jgi:peptidoglycan/xylan/chitin deacetylase (PgdA/CDA1 family)